LNLKIRHNLSNRIKVMFLGDINSSHLKKWILALADTYEISVFSFNGLEASSRNELNNCKVTFYCPSNSGKTNKFTYFLHYSRLKSAVASFQPEILHAHYASSYGFFGALLKRKKFIVSAWGSDIFEFPKKSFLHRTMLKFVLTRASVLMSTSEIMAQEIKLYTTKPIVITPFGVPINLFRRNSTVNKKGEKFIVGTVKSLEYVYGIDLLIYAFKEFNSLYPNSECHIYGRGSKEVEYRELVKSMGLSNVILFKGYVSNDSVPSVLSTFDTFCALSRAESFGVAVLEASSCGLPVVVNNIGGLQEVVDSGQTGFVVNALDCKSVVEKLMFIAKNPEEGKKMGLKGREWVEKKYSWQKSVVIMTEQYDTILID